MSLGRSKRHKRQNFTGPKRAERGSLDCIGISKTKYVYMFKYCTDWRESSNRPAMHLRGRHSKTHSVQKMRQFDGRGLAVDQEEFIRPLFLWST